MNEGRDFAGFKSGVEGMVRAYGTILDAPGASMV